MSEASGMYAMGYRTKKIKTAVASRILAGDPTPVDEIARQETEKENANPESPREAMEAYLRGQTEKHLPT